MKYGEIIEQCIEIRRTWNQVTHTLDGHADEFLKKVYLNCYPSKLIR
jgi:hypothetical protein